MRLGGRRSVCSSLSLPLPLLSLLHAPPRLLQRWHHSCPRPASSGCDKRTARPAHDRDVTCGRQVRCAPEVRKGRGVTRPVGGDGVGGGAERVGRVVKGGSRWTREVGKEAVGTKSGLCGAVLRDVNVCLSIRKEGTSLGLCLLTHCTATPRRLRS